MTPAPCPRQAHASPPPRELRFAPQHAEHTPAHRPPRALSSTISPIPATPMPSPANSHTHCEHPINICPTYPPLALHDPSPAHEPVSRSTSPLPGPWVCPAPPLRTPSPACHCVRYLSGRQHLSSCCERERGAATGHTYGQPCSTSRRPHPHAHCLRVPALPCRDIRADSAHNTGLAAEHSRALLMLCAGCESTLALQHTCIAGTHAMQHTMGADALLLWICTHTRKSGDGMDTTLK